MYLISKKWCQYLFGSLRKYFLLFVHLKTWKTSRKACFCFFSLLDQKIYLLPWFAPRLPINYLRQSIQKWNKKNLWKAAFKIFPVYSVFLQTVFRRFCRVHLSIPLTRLYETLGRVYWKKMYLNFSLYKSLEQRGY